MAGGQLGATLSAYTGAEGAMPLLLTHVAAQSQKVIVKLSNLTSTYDGYPHPVTVTTTPPGVIVSVTYGGSVVAPTAAGNYVVLATVTDAGFTGSAKGTLKIAKATATLVLGNFSPTYDGTPQTATATTAPNGLDVTFKYGRAATPPTNAGTYAVTATINDPNYQGATTGSLVIAKETAVVTIDSASLSVTYNGKPHAATATTNPPGFPVTFTYGGSAKAPVIAGDYNVVATINSPNAAGTANGVLHILPASATVTLGSLMAVFNGKPHAVTATTAPPKLPVNFTYAGSPTPPTAIGSYAVIGTITNPNYTGSTNGTLEITPIPPLATTGAATSLTAATAILNGSANPEGSDTNVHFQWGLDTTYGHTTNPQNIGAGSVTVPATASIPGLTPGTVYHFRLVADNGTTTTNATDKTFTTLSFPTFNPNIPPTALVAASGAKISISINPVGLATQISIKYGLTTGYGNQTAPVSIAAGKSFVSFLQDLPGLLPNKTYHYQIVTTSAAGTFTSQDLTFTTLSFDTTLVQKIGDTAPGSGGATFNFLGTGAVNVNDGLAYTARVSAGGTAPVNSPGVWADDLAGNLQLVALAGVTPAPDTNGALYTTMGDVVYNSNAGVAFGAQLKIANGLVTNATSIGIWSSSSGSLKLVARAGSPAPGGTTFNSFNALALSDSKTLVIGTMNLGTGVTSTTNSGFWEGTQESDLTLKIRSGDVVDGKTIASGTFVSPLLLVGGQTRCFASNTGDLCMLAAFTDKTTGLVKSISGVESLAAKVGDAVAGISGATYSVFGSPIINTHNHIAFTATLTANAGGVTTATRTGIWADDANGTRQLIARSGQPGTEFLTLTDPLYNNNHVVAFGSTRKVGKTNVAGLFCNSGGTVEAVAEIGDQAPGCASGTTFGAFTAMALPDTDGLVFLASLTGGGSSTANNVGIWMVDGNGELQLIVRTGDTLLPSKTVSSLLFLSYSTVVAGQSRSFARNGELTYLANFTDKTSAIFNVVVAP